MFHDAELTLAERRHQRDRREVARRYAEDRRRLVEECVRSIMRGDGRAGPC